MAKEEKNNPSNPTILAGPMATPKPGSDQPAPQQQVVQSLLIPVPQGLPTVIVTMNGVTIEVASPTIEQSVQAVDYVLAKIRPIIIKGGFDYV